MCRFRAIAEEKQQQLSCCSTVVLLPALCRVFKVCRDLDRRGVGGVCPPSCYAGTPLNPRTPVLPVVPSADQSNHGVMLLLRSRPCRQYAIRARQAARPNAPSSAATGWSVTSVPPQWHPFGCLRPRLPASQSCFIWSETVLQLHPGGLHGLHFNCWRSLRRGWLLQASGIIWLLLHLVMHLCCCN